MDCDSFGSLLLSLLTESMSSIVSANSGMVCRVERTVLASTARNLLGETGSCGGGPCGILGPCQGRLSSSSCGLLQPVVSASSDTLSGHVVYSSWRAKKEMRELNRGKSEFYEENKLRDITRSETIKCENSVEQRQSRKRRRDRAWKCRGRLKGLSEGGKVAMVGSYCARLQGGLMGSKMGN